MYLERNKFGSQLCTPSGSSSILCRNVTWNTADRFPLWHVSFTSPLHRLLILLELGRVLVILCQSWFCTAILRVLSQPFETFSNTFTPYLSPQANFALCWTHRTFFFHFIFFTYSDTLKKFIHKKKKKQTPSSFLYWKTHLLYLVSWCIFCMRVLFHLRALAVSEDI